MSEAAGRLSAGQTVWIECDWRTSEPLEHTVAKVGRTFARIVGWRAARIKLSTMRVFEGGKPYGWCWLTREAYEAHLARQVAEIKRLSGAKVQ